MSLAASDGGWGPLPWAPTLQAGSRPGKGSPGLPCSLARCRPATWGGHSLPVGSTPARTQAKAECAVLVTWGCWRCLDASGRLAPHLSPGSTVWLETLPGHLHLSELQPSLRKGTSDPVLTGKRDGSRQRPREVPGVLGLGAAIAVSAGFQTHCGRPGHPRQQSPALAPCGPRLAPVWTLQWSRQCVLSWPLDRRRPG